MKIGGYTIEVSNPDKVMFPEDGITKGDMVDYCRKVAKYMVPHLEGRPLTLQRYPGGIKTEGFFQKSASDYFPGWIRRAEMKKYGGTTNYVVCDKAATLVYLAGQSTVTHHTWLSRADRPEYPDLMVFDLDPSGASFEPVRKAAFTLRELLSGFGLAVFVKSTGSRGLHVTVPLDRSADYDAVRAFAENVARLMVSRDPEHLTVEQRINKRGDKVFIDTMRNSYSQTAVAPYTVRAKPGAPVAAPVEWDEIKNSSFLPQKYTVRNILQRLEKTGDPWKNIYREARSLKEAKKKLEKTPVS